MILEKVLIIIQVQDICKDNVDRIQDNYIDIYNKIS